MDICQYSGIELADICGRAAFGLPALSSVRFSFGGNTNQANTSARTSSPRAEESLPLKLEKAVCFPLVREEPVLLAPTPPPPPGPLSLPGGLPARTALLHTKQTHRRYWTLLITPPLTSVALYARPARQSAGCTCQPTKSIRPLH